jgi:DNA-directed RNA polymerase specialized sigma24 family protein
MSEQQRRVLDLTLAGWKPREIGKHLGLSRSSVRAALARARHHLRREGTGRPGAGAPSRSAVSDAGLRVPAKFFAGRRKRWAGVWRRHCEGMGARRLARWLGIRADSARKLVRRIRLALQRVQPWRGARGRP